MWFDCWKSPLPNKREMATLIRKALIYVTVYGTMQSDGKNSKNGKRTLRLQTRFEVYQYEEKNPYDHRVGEKNQFHFGMTLTHESMHYIYGLRDEYGQTSFSSDDKGNIIVIVILIGYQFVERIIF